MIAIIPARAGSKGLPGKNIKLLNGKPLIAYTIEAAQKSKNISRVIVSTDDNNIAEISKKFGAEVPFLRPDHLASDTALSIDVYEYTVKRLELEENISIESFIVLQPTSPLRTSQNIDDALKLFSQKNAFSVISYCQEHHPISWHKHIDKSGKIVPIFEDKLLNRQEIKPTYFPNGAIYILNKQVFQTRSYYGENSFAYLMQRRNSVDIDTLDDFEWAEFLLCKHKT
ncbi:MAG: acylneuraminate cytidylyltransferase family protein [Flavobacteriaceae bacterium]